MSTLEAIDEIKAVLLKHDLWGCVTVSDSERTHWVYHCDASWSCMTFDAKTGEARIRAKVADFKTKEGQHYVVQQTTSAIFNTRDYAAMLFGHMDVLAKKLEGQFDIEHHPFTDLQFKS